MAYDEAERDYEGSSQLKASAGSGANTTPYNSENVKLIYRANISAETTNLEETASGIEQLVIDMGGYIEDSSVDMNAGRTGTYRYGYYTVRVPSEKYQEFLDSISCSDVCTATNLSKSVQDVGQQYAGTATGLATLADSLTTIKYMCFDHDYCTTKELYDATMANWEGYEPLRQRILAEVPHFGNNDPYADEEMNWVVNMYYDICSKLYSTRAKRYKAGLYGASDHVNQGKVTWGTPDGRKFPDPIADAASPAQSRDRIGPTGVFASSCCYDQSKYLGGIALNLRMHPSVLANDEGIGKLRDITKDYFRHGGMEVQYNVVDTETLKAAQKDPDSHRDLVVRIAGFSAYFIELAEDLQNDIMARNENVL